MPIQTGARIQLRNVVLMLKTRTIGNSGLPDIVTIMRFGNGNLQWEAGRESYEHELDRGELDDVRANEQMPLTLSCEGRLTYHLSRGSESISIPEIVKGLEYGNFSTHGKPKYRGVREPWLEANGCPPYAFEIEVHQNPRLMCPDSQAFGEAFLFRYCRVPGVPADVNNGTFSLSAECNVLIPVVQRVQFSYSSAKDAQPLTNWVADPRA